MSAPVCTCWIEARQENERCGSVLECPKHQNGQVEKLNPYPSGAGTIRERLLVIHASRERLRALGEDLNRGAAIGNLAEKIFDECDAIYLALKSLEAASALPVDEPTPTQVARARAYMAECMAMETPDEDQEQNWILGHLVTFCAREHAGWQDAWTRTTALALAAADAPANRQRRDLSVEISCGLDDVPKALRGTEPR